LSTYLNSKVAVNILRTYELDGVEFSNSLKAGLNLESIFSSGITEDLKRNLAKQLRSELPKLSDPDMALNEMERFFKVARNPLSLAALIERDPNALPILLKIFSTSQYLANLIIKDPESYDGLRMTEGQPVTRATMVEEIGNELARIEDDKNAVRALASYKNRETLRIAFGDIIAEQSLRVVTRQISFLADAICNAALEYAKRKVAQKLGQPRLKNGQRCGFVILGLGKLGGEELNYSSDIDLIMLFEGSGETDGDRIKSNQEYFARVVKEFVPLLQESTQHGSLYRVDLRLRPEGSRGQAALSIEAALRYYDIKGRTWERQAFVKARPIAGDLDLGRVFLRQMQQWIYRPQLSQFEIASIKSLKRRIETRSSEQGEDQRNVKTGHGGIRDIEFAIQFLQLLHGAKLKTVRKQHTLRAIDRLQRTGCLTVEERSLLEKNYTWLRVLEHRLQLMFNLQTHSIPTSDQELTKLGIRMGFTQNPRSEFLDRLKEVTTKNRRMLDHLLHTAFGSESQPHEAPIVDLILHTNPDNEHIERVLAGYRFHDRLNAYRNLIELANENNPFLSTIRCRHFLASIAPKLLIAIAETPDPDATIVALNRVSDSLGGKSVLWELFHVHQPSLELYVRLCAISPLLTELLTSNPGMIDELMDALRRTKLPGKEFLRSSLLELIANAEDIDPILHSFKSSQVISIGTRDLMQRDEVTETLQALSDVAEVCLESIASLEYNKLVSRFGHPHFSENGRNHLCGFSILALGKLGGAELNYHSDLDIVFVYQADGVTDGGGTSDPTTNQHFFQMLASAITKRVSAVGPYGRLYELDNRLRPTGKSGSLAVSFEQLHRYHASGEGQLWERQAFCKARPIYGTDQFKDLVKTKIREVILTHRWNDEFSAEIRAMRARTEQGASPGNIKRGSGGTMDIDFLVQKLQLEYVRSVPEFPIPNTFSALKAFEQHKMLPSHTVGFLLQAYARLRLIESRLHLLNTRAVHDLPQTQLDRAKLAFVINEVQSDEFDNEITQIRLNIREIFQRHC
jgi:[glutamine synthetase] adenylyltransferase / [glutamine synthetase]-adenylyl-L-tyrosine phosphorylase